MIAQTVATFAADGLRSFLEYVAFGGKTDREVPDPPQVDCPDHGKTFLRRSRTACCNSWSWIPSGRVKSRQDGGRVPNLALARRLYADLARSG